MSKYAKTITALVTGILGWIAVVIASPSSPVTASEWLALGVVVATGLGVYGMPNSAPTSATVNDPAADQETETVATTTKPFQQGRD